MKNILKKIWDYHINLDKLPFYWGGKVRIILLVFMFLSFIPIIIAEVSWGIIIPEWIIWVVIIIWVIIIQVFKGEKDVYDS